MASRGASGIEIEEGVVFGRAGERELRCVVYRPAQRAALAPAILMLHGGGWSVGDPSMMSGYGRVMARRGYVCVTSEYRLTTEAPWPAQLEDARMALRWLRAEHAALGVDPARIVVWGQSAGGHLGLFIAGGGASRLLEGPAAPVETPPVAAAVAFYPVTTIGPEMGESWERYGGGIVSRDAPEQLRRLLGPLSYVDARFPPTMLLHGARDALVAPQQSVRFYDALVAQGVPASLHIFANVAHGFDLERALALQCADLVTSFLERYAGRGDDGGAA